MQESSTEPETREPTLHRWPVSNLTMDLCKLKTKFFLRKDKSVTGNHIQWQEYKQCPRTATPDDWLCGIRRLTGRADVEDSKQDMATGLSRRSRSRWSKRQSMPGKEINTLQTPLMSEGNCQQNSCKGRENTTYMGNSKQASEDSQHWAARTISKALPGLTGINQKNEIPSEISEVHIKHQLTRGIPETPHIEEKTQKAMSLTIHARYTMVTGIQSPHHKHPGWY